MQNIVSLLSPRPYLLLFIILVFSLVLLLVCRLLFIFTSSSHIPIPSMLVNLSRYVLYIVPPTSGTEHIRMRCIVLRMRILYFRTRSPHVSRCKPLCLVASHCLLFILYLVNYYNTYPYRSYTSRELSLGLLPVSNLIYTSYFLFSLASATDASLLPLAQTVLRVICFHYFTLAL